MKEIRLAKPSNMLKTTDRRGTSGPECIVWTLLSTTMIKHIVPMIVPKTSWLPLSLSKSGSSRGEKLEVTCVRTIITMAKVKVTRLIRPVSSEESRLRAVCG